MKSRQTKSKSVGEVISIRPATIDDCDKCAKLLLGQLAEHGVTATEKQLVPVLQKIVSNETYGFLLLARCGATPVGVAYAAIILSAEHCGKVVWLEELYVAPQSRSIGIGAALLAAVIDQAQALGIVAIDLEIDAGHRRAESLYRRFGFHSLNRSRWVKSLRT